MIKINLARKRSAAVAAGKVESGKTKINLDALKSLGKDGGKSLAPLFYKIGIPVMLGIIANFGYDQYVDSMHEEMANELRAIEVTKEKINKELAAMKGFESTKAELDRTSTVIRAKIDTIENLIKERDFTPKSILSLVQSLPKDAWLTEFSQGDKNYTFRGGAMDIGMISDFMSRLGHTIYYKDVTLRNTTNDQMSRRILFELSARRD